MCSEELDTTKSGGHDPLLPPPVFGFAHLNDENQFPKQAVVILDRTACVIAWDADAERLFGYPASTAVGKSFYHFLELESLTPGNLERELQTAYYRGQSICNRHYTHHDGFQFRATAEIAPLWDGEFLGYTVTFSSARRIVE
jgi:PAS domain-containing protein